MAKKESDDASEHENVVLSGINNNMESLTGSSRGQILVDQDEYNNLKSTVAKLSEEASLDSTQLNNINVTNTTYLKLDPTYYNYLYYFVKDKMCYVYYNIYVFATTSSWSVFTQTDAVPKSKAWLQFSDKGQNATNGGIVLGVSTDGALRIIPYGTGVYSGMFVYPIS